MMFSRFAIVALSFGLLVAVQTYAFAEEPAPAAPAAEASAPEALPTEAPVLSEEEKTKIKAAATQGVQDEVKVFGSFEIDHPDTDELLKLQLVEVKGDVRTHPDGMFVTAGEFKDEAAKSYVVELYLESFEPGEYEIVDAILVEVAGQAVGKS